MKRGILHALAVAGSMCALFVVLRQSLATALGPVEHAPREVAWIDTTVGEQLVIRWHVATPAVPHDITVVLPPRALFWQAWSFGDHVLSDRLQCFQLVLNATPGLQRDAALQLAREHVLLRITPR
jgi:hypothetical protein